MDELQIQKIEKALDIELYNDQKKYLLNDNNYFYWYGGRRSGKTLAHCIKLALSDGEPLDMRKPEEFCDSDYGIIDNKRKYAKSYYRSMFMNIWTTLKENGFKVREIIK